MQKVDESILAPAVTESRVIPNGVDLSIFHPSEREAARRAVGLPLEATILLFVSYGIRNNPFKDYETLQSAALLAAAKMRDRNLLLVTIGEKSHHEKMGNLNVHAVPYQSDATLMAYYYRSADVYIHAARAETFPTSVLCALACGTPVVATAVGGIPEQVKGFDASQESGNGATVLNRCTLDEATGALVGPGDAQKLAHSIKYLLRDATVLRRLGENGARDARRRFDLDQQVEHYLNWYKEISLASKSL
jgi:glycosyltransferase involved in cell wall biosynthesis